MHSLLSRAASCLIFLSFFLPLIACEQHHEAPKRRAEPYVASAGAVGFDILPLGNTDGTRRWIATYNDGQNSTKFRVEITAANESDQAGNNAGSSTGKILSEAGSNPIPLLEALQKALQAKHFPRSVKKLDELPFEYTILGQDQTKLPTGSFKENPKGNWTVMKISIGQQNSELFLNLDTFDHQGEFSIKDASSGDALLGEFARVL